jgi:tetratricopeptide (TPR) repeat protein
MLILVSCGKSAVKMEVNQNDFQKETSDKENMIRNIGDKKSFYYNCELFRFNLKKSFRNPYTLSNRLYFTALSNEFRSDDFRNWDMQMDKTVPEGQSNAVNYYNELLVKNPEEAPYLHQRIGISCYKLARYPEANKFLSLAVLEKADNSELYYYQSLLCFFYLKNLKLAESYIRKIKPDNLYISLQDFLAYEALLYYSMGSTNTALGLYQSAININPSRFYANYDLTIAYVETGDTGRLKDYIDNSWMKLMSLKDPKYHVKGYSQKIFLNSLLKTETYQYDFNLPNVYNYYQNILYGTRNPVMGKREKSGGLEIPFKERKWSKKDDVFSGIYEDYVDYPKNSGIFLIEGVAEIKTVNNRFPNLSPAIPKLTITSNFAMLLSATNLIPPITNIESNQNSVTNIITNVSNVTYVEPIQFQYFLNAQSFDVDKDGVWDYVSLGFVNTNQAVLSVFYPALKKWEYAFFVPKTSDASIVIQDINNKGTNEVILLDDDVYFLKLKKITNKGNDSKNAAGK